MPGMRGSIEADYSEFRKECDSAAAALGKIDAQGKQTEQSLVKMENSVASGKISKALEDTVLKVDKAAVSAKAADTSFGQMSDGLRVADKTLNQFGVSLGPTIGSLDEMAKVATTSTGALGALGTASAVAGAALAGWNIGRWIADLTGADKVVANFTARLLGLGDVAAQEAAAGQDALRLASERSGRTITDTTEAIRINHEGVKNNTAQHQSSAAVLNAYRDRIAGLGPKQAELRAEIEAGVLSHEKLATRYKITTEAVDWYAKRLDQQKTADEKAASSAKALATAQAEVDALRGQSSTVIGTMSKATQAQVAADLKLGASQADVAKALGLTEAQVKSVAVAMQQQKAATEQLTAANNVVSAAQQQFHQEEITASATATQKRLLDIGTWRATQMAALAATKGATVEHYEALDKVYQDKLAKENAATAAAVKEQQRLKDEAAAAAAAAYQAETDAMVEAYVEAQYGAGAAATAQAGHTAAVQQTTAAYVQLNTALGQNKTAMEEIASGYELMEAYVNSGVGAVLPGTQLAAQGYNFAQMQRAGRPGVNMAPGLGAPAIATGAWAQPWGNQNTLTVNVNNAQAADIANKLVTEMRHSGVRF